MKEKYSNWFQINNMSHSLETTIQVFILIAKYKSPVMVIRQLQHQGTTTIPAKACNHSNIPKIPRNRLG